MKKFQAPDPPFVQAHNVNSKQRPTAIMLSLSWTTSEEKAALAIASNLHRANAPVNSYHYMVDAAETYRGVWDNVGAANTPHGAIDVLMCGQPQENLSAWSEAGPKSMLDRSADLVADLCLTYKLPPLFLSEEGEAHWLKRRRRRRGGLISRIPGVWPQEEFEALVNSKINRKAV